MSKLRYKIRQYEAICIINCITYDQLKQFSIIITPMHINVLQMIYIVQLTDYPLQIHSFIHSFVHSFIHSDSEVYKIEKINKKYKALMLRN